MTIQSKDLLVAVKAYSRGNPLPLDASEVHGSLGEAEAYAKSAKAYAGQTIKALQNGKYESYVLNGEPGNYTLEKVGLKAEEVKTTLFVVSSLPGSNQEQGVLYINTADSKGYIWTGAEWKVVFEDISKSTDIADINKTLDTKANLSGATFTGTVTLAADPQTNMEAVTKQYVDTLMNGLNSFTVDILDSTHSLPTEGYKVGQTFRVVEQGTYAGVVCEPGDLVIVIQDFNGVASNADFLVVQANIDGALTASGQITGANLVVFDGTTRIKETNITLSSLEATIKNSHNHANKEILDSYNKTQTALLEEVNQTINTAQTTLQSNIDKKLDSETAKTTYITPSAVDSKLQPIQDNLNTKFGEAEVSKAINDRLGAKIDVNTTVADYIDTAVGAGGTASAEAIAKAKQEAIEYTDRALTIIEIV